MNELEYDLMTYLLPLYLDKKTNSTTNAYIEEILSRSPECRELYEAMAADMNLIREPLKNKTGHIGPVGKIVIAVAVYIAIVILIVTVFTIVLTYGVF